MKAAVLFEANKPLASPCHARKGRVPEWGRHHPHGAEDAWQTAFAFSETNLTR